MRKRNGMKEKGLSHYGISESACKEIDGYNTRGRMHPVMNISRKISMIVQAIALIFTLFAAPAANAASHMGNGLIAYFPFDGDAEDVSENGNHGIEVGSVTYSEGAVGLAATFDGNGFIEAAGGALHPRRMDDLFLALCGGTSPTILVQHRLQRGTAV